MARMKKSKPAAHSPPSAFDVSSPSKFAPTSMLSVKHCRPKVSANVTADPTPLSRASRLNKKALPSAFSSPSDCPLSPEALSKSDLQPLEGERLKSLATVSTIFSDGPCSGTQQKDKVKKPSSSSLEKKKAKPESPTVQSSLKQRLRTRTGKTAISETPSKSSGDVDPICISNEESVPVSVIFCNSDAQAFFKRTFEIPILIVKPIHRHLVDETVNEVIDRHGWAKWVSCLTPWYPKAVRQFYANETILCKSDL
ncbi:hypothetical protein AXF42_Ash003627 [Apostasia shenzhenica]|uniref:Uncharacterized protein n=1 Tax=Apostasia shenzhenica TaxID=1088818 RepID=A0A2I0AHG6_9ASPA|nr:hypothetical protein AXF42_Ash003627 [Apostasia shenzhenica]